MAPAGAGNLRLPPTFSDEGLVAALAIRERHPGVGVLVLSTYVETSYAVRLLQGNARGVGYLLKDRVDDAATLLAGIERVARGETVIDALVVTRLLDRSNATKTLDVLSQREREVLALLAQGRTNSAIAQTLFLSPKTVEAHVASTFTKLGITSAPDANRRVLAVLTYLRVVGQARGVTPVASPAYWLLTPEATFQPLLPPGRAGGAGRYWPSRRCSLRTVAGMPHPALRLKG